MHGSFATAVPSPLKSAPSSGPLSIAEKRAGLISRLAKSEADSGLAEVSRWLAEIDVDEEGDAPILRKAFFDLRVLICDCQSHLLESRIVDGAPENNREDVTLRGSGG